MSLRVGESHPTHSSFYAKRERERPKGASRTKSLGRRFRHRREDNLRTDRFFSFFFFFSTNDLWSRWWS